MCNALSPDVDLDGGDTDQGVELPGADLSGKELTMPSADGREAGRRVHLRLWRSGRFTPMPGGGLPNPGSDIHRVTINPARAAAADFDPRSV